MITLVKRNLHRTKYHLVWSAEALGLPVLDFWAAKAAAIPEHRLQTNAAVTPGDLQEAGWIMEKNLCTFQLLEVAVGPSRVRPSVRYQAIDSATILAMDREGLGITLMPRMMLPKKLDGVVALPLDPPYQLQIGLALRWQAMASRAAQLLVQTASTWVLESACLHP